MTAFLCDILVTPIESTIVTTATRPSGIAATASEIASMKVSIMTSMLRRPALITPSANMNAHMTSTSLVSISGSGTNVTLNSQGSSSACARASAILPISVSMPVAVMTTLPLPYTTALPMYTMLVLSPSGTSFAPSAIARAPVCLVTGTDSPVRAASSTFMDASSMMRPSAGTLSPASSMTTSPTTSSLLSTLTICPSLSTFDLAAVICFKASMASSALFSCTTPSTELSMTTNNIMKTSDGFSP